MERSLDRLHEQEARLHEQMADAATDPEELTRLTAELADLGAQEEALETEWLEASEIAEA